MAGDDRKRQRKSSDNKLKSPSETQASKKVRQVQNLDESLNFDNTSDTKTNVSEKNMAAKAGAKTDKADELIEALKTALQDESVIEKLKEALSEQIKKEIRQEYDTQINELKSEIAKRDVKIDELKQRTEELEMYGRRNGIRIYGLKESPNENTDKLVLQLAKDIKANISDDALGRSHRVGPKNDNMPRPIIAKFTGHNSKVEILKHKKELRTDDLEEKYGKDTVFINEDLTKTRAGWAKRARVLKKLKKTSETWTRDGTIFIKHTDDRIDKVNNEQQMKDIEASFGVVAGVYVPAPQEGDQED